MNIQQSIDSTRFALVRQGGAGAEGAKGILEALVSIVRNDPTIAAEINQLLVGNSSATAVNVLSIFVSKWTASLGTDVLAGLNVIAAG